jgi:hypothetical protein
MIILTGSAFMLDLLDFLRDQQLDGPTNQLATTLIVELTEERKILKEIIESQGGEVPADGRRLAGIKVNPVQTRSRSIWDFRSPLALGILGKLALGKLALWQTFGTLQTDMPACCDPTDGGGCASDHHESV